MGERKAPTPAPANAKKPAPPPGPPLREGQTRGAMSVREARQSERPAAPPAMGGREPESPAEWQEAVNCAAFLLLLHSARLYGLIEGGPDVDVERCDGILKRGREMGYRPKGI